MRRTDRPHPSTSSGDLLADRRYSYACALLAEGDAAAAADLLGQVLDLVPGWAPAWLTLGAAEEARGDRGAAADAYARGAAADQDGTFGARLHLARLRGELVPMPHGYVAAVFDEYAPRFDRHLVETLAYRGPALLLGALRRSGAPPRFGHALDLGCGTGLMGRAVRPLVDRLDGVDLSPAMVAEAQAGGLYDDLAVGDLMGALAARPGGTLDLVVAADVFVYLGPLEPVVAAAARTLRPGGHLAFTVQHSPDVPVRLGEDLRFAHSRDHVSAALHQAGLEERLVEAASTRREAGRDVPGLVVIARAP